MHILIFKKVLIILRWGTKHANIWLGMQFTLKTQEESWFDMSTHSRMNWVQIFLPDLIQTTSMHYAFSCTLYLPDNLWTLRCSCCQDKQHAHLSSTHPLKWIKAKIAYQNQSLTNYHIIMSYFSVIDKTKWLVNYTVCNICDAILENSLDVAKCKIEFMVSF